MMEIDEEIVEFARLGGALLGGGGGGSMEEGKIIGEMAVRIGTPFLVNVEDLRDEATIATVSAVGAPAAKEAHAKPIDYVRAIKILEAHDIHVDGIITCENGGLATLNGWFQSAVLNIPVVDAPANGRAHPMGIMGSMGLHAVEGYVSKQAGVGGSSEKGRRFEIYVSGPLDRVAKIIRQMADLAGGLVAVARNPISAKYVREKAAVGAITQAIELGRIMTEATSGDDMVERILQHMGGTKIGEGVVQDVKLETKGGFDIGGVKVKAERKEFELTFWNEYMCVEKEGSRLATFPDLIATVGFGTKRPLTTAEIEKGQRVVILHVPKKNLNLGAGMRDPKLFEEVERVTGKEIIRYL
jgi:DUF917 family protein